jgi:hypothetical protein
VIQDNVDQLLIPLDLSGCMIHFKHQLPTTEEVNSLKQYCLTQGNTPWNPSSFSDKVADKFNQHVIHNEQKKTLNTISDHSSDIKFDIVEQDIPKFSYLNPSDAHDTNVKVKHANLLFHLDTAVMNNANDINNLNKEYFYRKALLAKVNYKKLSPYFAFLPYDVIQYTLRQTTQLTKSTIHYPMTHHLKSRFQMLRHKRLNEIIATDTYFANEKSIKGYHCAQVFFGMTSKMLYVAGMKTESEFVVTFIYTLLENTVFHLHSEVIVRNLR